MARFTTAYSGYTRRVMEIETLRKHAAAKERLDPLAYSKDVNALCRSAVVLLTAHLEAYIKELGETALESLVSASVSRAGLATRFYYHLSHDLITEIKDTSDPERIADKLFAFIGRDLDLWSKTGPFTRPIPTDQFNKGFANPGFKKIKKYFHRFGYAKYDSELAALMKGAYRPTVNMVDHLVDTRNKIAHGDPDATKTPSEIKDMLTVTRSFCAATDAVFAAWWKGSFCPIR